jgi:tripeptidyl-peptidase-1
VATEPIGGDVYVIHEKRDRLPPNWRKREKLDGNFVLPIRIALAQKNLDIAEKLLMDVSHPESPNYGRHMTSAQIIDIFAPRQETVSAVTKWLHDFGINTTHIKTSASKGWLSFKLKISDVERLLKTKYYVYEHINGKRHPATEEYSVPAAIQHHIDFIAPTLHFDVKVNRNSKESNGLKKRSLEDVDSVSTGPFKTVRVGGLSRLATSQAGNQLSSCSSEITLPCLQTLYNFTNYKQKASGKNNYSIVEYTGLSSYNQADLKKFLTQYNPNAENAQPVFDSIDGGVINSQDNFNTDGEGNLDLQYAIGLVYPTPVILYQTGDIYEGGSFNTFLDAIDGSYCKFEGGDNPTYDPPYPDPYYKRGYQGHDCGRYKPANVISTSYTYNEADLSPAYEQRQCTEYMKLGMQGVTILYSSGDYGVAGNGGTCLANGAKFNPSFPGTCPWITSVGATQINPNLTVYNPEIACQDVITSGGGFSNVFTVPNYQSAAMTNFFNLYTPSYNSSQYNNSQNVRGYPDISANGANYVVVIAKQFYLVYGTSCSSPVVGSIVTLINDARLAVGKGPVGFWNPVLYNNSYALNDITSGNNPGCGTNGFSAVPGWDPVTGLGTPNFQKLVNLFLSLP